MASVTAVLSASFIDKIGVVASATPIYASVDDSNTLADIMTQFNGVLVDMQPLSDAKLFKASISFEGTQPIIGDPTNFADSNCEQGLLTNVSQVGSRYKFGIWIPAITDGLVVDGKIDVANADYVTFLTRLAATVAALQLRGKYGNLLGGLVDAAEAFRKLRRRAEKLTKTA